MSTLPAYASAEKVAAAKSPVRVEQVSCPLCNCNRHEALFAGRDPSGTREEFLVVRCVECGLQFTNPRPTAEAIAQYYPDDYPQHARPSKSERPLRDWYPLDWMAKPQVGQGRLLDFGCGAGIFLDAMKKRGWDVLGLDLSSAAVRAVRQQGMRAVEGTLPHPDLKPASFDLVTLWHALEHVHDPVATLREVRQLLAPGGRLVLGVPNAGGWQCRWFGKHWNGIDVPRHLTHFSDETLRTTLEVAGFSVRGLRHSRHPMWVRDSARRAWAEGPFSLSAGPLRSRRLSRLAARLLSNGSWGDAILVWAEPNG